MKSRNMWPLCSFNYLLIILYIMDVLDYKIIFIKEVPIPVAARSKAWVYSRSLSEIVGSNPAGSMDVCVKCCVLSGRGLYDGLITRPEKSYRL